MGSSTNAKLFATLSGLAELNSVVAILGFLVENCIASFSIGYPLALQCSTALRQASTSDLGAGCQSGTPLLDNSPIESGEALMTPMPCCSN